MTVSLDLDGIKALSGDMKRLDGREKGCYLVQDRYGCDIFLHGTRNDFLRFIGILAAAVADKPAEGEPAVPAEPEKIEVIC